MDSLDTCYRNCPWAPTLIIFGVVGISIGLWRRLRWNDKYKRDLFGPDAPVAEPMLVAVIFGFTLGVLLLSFYKSACGGRTAGVCEFVVRNPPWILLTGVIASPPVLLTWYWSASHKQQDIKKGREDIEKGRQDLALERESHLTERFTKAAELLGHDKVAVRTGAIYALERIASDSPRDQKNIVETLSAFAREASAVSAGTGSAPAQADVVAAVTALGRIPRRENQSFSLRGARLIGANLDGLVFDNVEFEAADLTDVSLRGAGLVSARLRGATLDRADLRHARLDQADLRRASLTSVTATEATFTKAKLDEASLGNAAFIKANLTEASLLKADLHMTFMTGAILKEAKVLAEARDVDFGGADLRGADLSGIGSQTTSTFKDAVYDGATRFPARWDAAERTSRGLTLKEK